MYTESRTIDHILSNYTANVREVASRVLLTYGFTGLDPRENNDGPHSLAEIMDVFSTPTRKFPVNVVGSDKTVYTDPTVNLLFRAWHDIGHALLNAGFDEDGERRVAEWQASMLKGIDKEIMRADVVDQFDYYRKNGKYVEDQRTFVIDKVFGKRGKLPPHSPRYAVLKKTALQGDISETVADQSQPQCSEVQ